jgi:hypothetical protein
LFIFWKIQINSNKNSKWKLIISTQSVMCSTSFVSLHWSWNTHLCLVVCNPGMNFMKVHAFLLKGWFSFLNTLCELVSNRKSSSPLSSARESVTSTCYPRFKNMKWFWQDKHDSREFYNSLMTGKFFFFLWQAALLEKPWLHLKWLHFRLTLIPLLISPKSLYRINFLLTLGRF